MTQLVDNRPESSTVFDGQERKYFELSTFHDGKQSIPVPPHHQGNEDHQTPVPCKVYLPQDPRCTRQIIEAFPAYKNWLRRLLHNLKSQDTDAHTFHSNPYRLESIDLQAPTWFSTNKLGFLKAQCTIQTEHANPDGKKGWLPGAVFLRGGSVGVLIIIQPYDDDDDDSSSSSLNNPPINPPTPELYSILTIQPRIAASSLAFAELPAGMLDDAGDLRGKAGDEINEEVGIAVRADDLFDMSAAAVRDVPQLPYSDLDLDQARKLLPGEHVADSMYPSPGGCDEFMPLMLLQKRMRRGAIEALKGRKTGLRAEGEVIAVKVVRFEELWREGGRDAKCLAALGLYENLKRVGGLPRMPARPDE